LKCVTEGFNEAVSLSNDGASSHEWTVFASLRSAHVRPWNTIEILIECMLSTTQVQDLQRRNPFLSASACSRINQILTISLLKFVRTRQIMDCIQLAGVAQEFICSLANSCRSPLVDLSVIHDSSKTLHFHLSNLAEQLCRHRTKNDTTLCPVSAADISSFANRFYVLEVIEESSAPSTLHIDPRLLVFEFISAFMLRTRQIELAFDFMQKIKDGACSVQQMVMAAGKTSVVTPLLALLLSGTRFVTCVCPAELLNQSRLEIRKKYSSILKKSVVTFTCSRESGLENLKRMAMKLQEAEAENSVICTTPQSVKSAFLKFTEIGLKLVSGKKDGIDQTQAMRSAQQVLARENVAQALKTGSYEAVTAKKEQALKSEMAVIQTRLEELLQTESWHSGRERRDEIVNLHEKFQSLSASLQAASEPQAKIDFERETQRLVHASQASLQHAQGLVEESELFETLDCLKHILSIWKKPSSIALLDEVDLIMNPLKSEMIFPIGHKEDLPLTDVARDRIRFNLPIHLIVLMLQAASASVVHNYSNAQDDSITLRDLRECISEGIHCKSIQHKVHPPPAFDEIICLDPKFYDKKIRPALGALAVSWLLRNSFFNTAVHFRANQRVQFVENPSKAWLASSKGLIDSFDAATGKYLVKLDQILCDQHNITPNPHPFAYDDIKFAYDTSLQEQQLLEHEKIVETNIRLFVAGGSNHSEMHSLNLHPEAVSFLNLAKDIVSVIIPHIFSKFHRVSYGLLHPQDYVRWNEQKSQNWTMGRNISSVPFDKINLPSKEAEFAHPDVRLLIFCAFVATDFPFSDSHWIHSAFFLVRGTARGRHHGAHENGDMRLPALAASPTLPFSSRVCVYVCIISLPTPGPSRFQV